MNTDLSDPSDETEIIRRARRRWMQNQLPRLIFPLHMMLFVVGSFAIFAASGSLWSTLGFPPGWLILGWLVLLILHYGATVIWSSYHRAIEKEVERERTARAEAWAAEKRKRETPTPSVGVGDDGELFEIAPADRLLDKDGGEDKALAPSYQKKLRQ